MKVKNGHNNEAIDQGWSDFLFVGQIWQLFFIAGHTIQKIDEKVTISAKQEKMGSFDAFIDSFRPNFL
jgi:hypothetical protein